MSDETTLLREKLNKLIIEIERLDIKLDSPAYDMTLGEYEQEREKLLDEFEQAIAATLGSDTKPCYAADENYKRCKYSVNRGWCDDAPFIVWDDTGHLFITMGGLKTWDVTDDAKKWFAELGNGTLTAEQVREAIMSVDRWEKPMGNTGMTNTHLIIRDDGWQAIADELNARAERTCKFVSNKGSDYPPACSVCGYELGIYDCEWFEDGTYGYDGNYCPNCGARVVDA